MQFLKYKNKTVRSMDQAGTWSESTLRRFGLEKCRASVEREGKFVLRIDEEVLIPSLSGVWDDDTEVVQVIIVDVDKKAVWDCLDKYGLNMDPSVFEHYVRNIAWFRIVKELKQSYVQPVVSLDRKRRKTNRDEREAKPVAARCLWTAML